MMRRYYSWRPVKGAASRCTYAAVLLCSLSSYSMAAPELPSAASLQTHATGVFLNSRGDVLTAYHAVQHCASISTIKYRQVVPATLIAHHERHDLAVLQTSLQPYVSATFMQAAGSLKKGQPVFTQSYSELQRMEKRGQTLYNAVITADKELSMLSDVRPGASGGAVLGASGLLLGMVVERHIVAPRPAGKIMLSRPTGQLDEQAATRVRAVAADDIKLFLRQHHIPFQESDAAQLGHLQAQAPRAATLAVGILCHEPQ